MRMIFRVYHVASIFFVLSIGTAISVNDSLEFVHSSDDLPSKFEDECEKKFINNNPWEIHLEPVDCVEVFENGFHSNGVYKIHPRSKNTPCGGIKVYCDMETDGGGWTVIQRRVESDRAPDYFHKIWDEYKTGFGNLETEFWLGNDNIHALTNQKRYSVRFDLAVDKETAYATYDKFWIENEELKYRLYITDYNGNAGDSMKAHHNQSFSTKDRRNNIGAYDCAKIRKGGWWYTDCAAASLNGVYLKGSYTSAAVNDRGIYWTTWKKYTASLTHVEIKIRPFDFQIQ